jgi:hypothetical protein
MNIAWQWDRIFTCWQAVIDGKPTDYIIKGRVDEFGCANFDLWRLHEGQHLAEYGSARSLEVAKDDLSAIIQKEAI